MHVTAKPSSFQCNLKCDYCFYLEKESQFTHEKWMDDSTLKEFIKQYIAASGNQVYFTWQGGEPTLAGLDFFRKVIHYQQRYAGQKRIFNALQTNGILLNNMTVENVNTAVKQYLSHPVNTYTGVLLPK